MRYSYSKIGGMAMIEKVGVYCRLSDEDRFKANKNDDFNFAEFGKKIAFTNILCL